MFPRSPERPSSPSPRDHRGGHGFRCAAILLALLALHALGGCALDMPESLSRASRVPLAPPPALTPEADRAWLDRADLVAPRTISMERADFLGYINLPGAEEDEPVPVLDASEVIPAGAGGMRRITPYQHNFVRDEGARRLRLVAEPGSGPDDGSVIYQFLWAPPGETPALLDAVGPGHGGWVFRRSFAWLHANTLRIDPPVGDDPTGIMVFIPGQAITQYDSSVRTRFRERGWRVITAHSFNHFGDRMSATITPQTSPEEAVHEIARGIDERLLHKAMSVEAAIEMLRAEDPRLAHRPVVIAGFSAGAIMAPTVAARNPGLYDAMLLVAGGSHLLDIGLRSTFSRNIRFESINGHTITPQFLASANEAYLRASRLDPYHTAPTLRNMPILMLHGVNDDWVPADRGVELWKRLGKPRRWVFPGGHRIVFWRLPSLAGKLERWAHSEAISAMREKSRHQDLSLR